jgi:hypothetical protein
MDAAGAQHLSLGAAPCAALHAGAPCLTPAHLQIRGHATLHRAGAAVGHGAAAAPPGTRGRLHAGPHALPLPHAGAEPCMAAPPAAARCGRHLRSPCMATGDARAQLAQCGTCDHRTGGFRVVLWGCAVGWGLAWPFVGSGLGDCGAAAMQLHRCLPPAAVLLPSAPCCTASGMLPTLSSTHKVRASPALVWRSMHSARAVVHPAAVQNASLLLLRMCRQRTAAPRGTCAINVTSA